MANTKIEEAFEAIKPAHILAHLALVSKSRSRRRPPLFKYSCPAAYHQNISAMFNDTRSMKFDLTSSFEWQGGTLDHARREQMTRSMNTCLLYTSDAADEGEEPDGEDAKWRRTS